jgi:hypothetical protein
MKFKYGQTVRDITGYEGKVTAYSEFMNGCKQFCVETLDNDGCVTDKWLDEQRLELAPHQPDDVIEVGTEPTGGPSRGPSASRR